MFKFSSKLVKTKLAFTTTIIITSLMLGCLLSIPERAASVNWLYAEAENYRVPYKSGMHVATLFDQNGNEYSVASFTPLRAQVSEQANAWAVRLAYGQNDWKVKLADQGKKSTVSGISKEMTLAAPAPLFAPGTLKYYLTQTGIVYEVYIPKAKTVSQQNTLNGMAQNLKFLNN